MLPRIRSLRLIILGATLTVLAACQPVAAPPAPRAPVVQPQYTPRAPTPPFGASSTTIIPALRPDGMRQTINRDLGPLETLWHVRAALNVAALSCTAPQYDRLIGDYNAFIRNNKSYLRNANNAIISKYRREVGSGYKSAHDRHQTALYNYWSFSPLRRPFCDQAVEISQRAIITKSDSMKDFGAQALIQLEKPFSDFYSAYEEYERDLEAWYVQYQQPRPAGG